jgi:hypothetical protein
MPRKKSDELLIFDEDSPLVAPKKAKKRATKKATPPSKSRKGVDLTKDSPLVADRPKKRGPKSKAEKEEEEALAEQKRIAEKRAKSFKPKKRKKLPNVRKPSDCKHIKRAEFKKMLNAKWKLLTEGTIPEAEAVGSWISGAARVIEHDRPDEFEELTVLSRIAKQIARERND